MTVATRFQGGSKFHVCVYRNTNKCLHKIR